MGVSGTMSARDRALLQLLRELDDRSYDFVTPTPATQARNLDRHAGRTARDLREIFGWSMAFRPIDHPGFVVELLLAAGALNGADGVHRSTIRVSRLHGRLFIHSAYPTAAADSVFFGPDSYRFADFVVREVETDFAGWAVDVGGGCGAGAITLAARAPRARITITDINPTALKFAQVNAHSADLAIQVEQTDGLAGQPRGLDLVIANPPYMAQSKQTYRNGGDMHGAGLSLEWASQALRHLKPGGRMLLYTGSAIGVGGTDTLRNSLETLAFEQGAEISYREIDPDVFGEELCRSAYRDVERIAVVECILTAGPTPRRGT